MMNDHQVTVQARLSALVLAVAVTTASAMALASADRSGGPRRLSTQPSPQRTAAECFVCGLELLPSAFDTDTELARDRANEHHS
jgi:hypothetical protein